MLTSFQTHPLMSAAQATLVFAMAGLCQAPHSLPSNLAEPGTPVLVAKEGAGTVFSEGVAADWNGNVYSNEMDNNKRTMRLKVGTDMSKSWRQATDNPNGMWLDSQNRLVICQMRAIVRVKTGETFDNQTDTLFKYPESGNPEPFNDITGDSRDNLFFSNLNGNTVYFRNASTGQTTVAIANSPKPNGLEWDQERKLLYVNEHEVGKVVAYPVNDDYTLGERREVFSMTLPDGITLDQSGNLYVVSYNSGIQAYTPEGQKLGEIPISGSQITNLAFGGADFKTLYTITNKGLYKLPMKVAGYKSDKPTSIASEPFRRVKATPRHFISRGIWPSGLRLDGRQGGCAELCAMIAPKF